MNCIKILLGLHKLHKNTKKSRSQIKNEQNEKLRKLLVYAFNNSKYYRRTFEANGINKNNIFTLPLSKFPSIDKTIMFEHFDEIVTDPDLKQEEILQFDENEEVSRKPFKGKYHVIHSSGSTGKPRYFVYDEDAWNTVVLAVIRGAFWNMSIFQIIRQFIRRLRILYVASASGRYGGAMAAGDGIDASNSKQLYLDVNIPLSVWLERIKKFKPNMIIGYPSAIKILAKMVEKGEISLKVFRIISCAEPLGSSTRKYFERVFNAEVINFYGASESVALGAEINHEEGMLLFDDLNILEVEDGQLYLTSLYNFAQPLIRYKLTDKILLKEADDDSGKPFTIATKLLGRNEDILWFEDEKGCRDFIHPLTVDSFCIEGMRDYQFRPLSKHSFEILVEAMTTADFEKIRCELFEQVTEILKEKQLDYVQFSVQFVDKIFADPKTGKKRLIVLNSKKEETR